MNNASLLLNAARPSAPAHTASPAVAPAASSAASSATSAADTVAPQKHFGHAMDAARADTQGRKSAAADHEATTAAKAPAKSSDDKDPKAAADTKKDDPSATKDDDADTKDAANADSDNTSLAASMLALIGVPVQVTQIAAKGLGLAKDVATGNAGAALAALTGAKGDTTDSAAAAQGTGLDALTAATATGAVSAAPGAATASPFAALLATEGAATAVTKDDAKGIDLAAAGPMPLAHAPAAGDLGGVTQLQATQATTSPQFSQALGEQIAWMSSAAGDIKEARIKLHPEEMGSMDVRVNVDGGKVNVAIMAQHPAAVHAVQQTLSNLDSMLAHHGLSLGQAEVNQGGAQQHNDNQGQGQGSGSASPDGGDDTLMTAATSRVSRGLVDEVA